MASPSQKKLKNIPAVNTILERDDVKSLISDWSFGYVSFETKKQVETARRQAIKAGIIENADFIAAEVKRAFRIKKAALIKPVINATGVALHTNLGRAPVDEKLARSVLHNCVNYCNLEYDLIEGKRSKRGTLAGEMAAVLGGAEAGLVVNNNAAAVLLAVNCFARDKEVLISRGELIQIGGGFRIPEMIEAAGAILKEIGTTNRTVISDYSKKITGRTALILKVHKSNFEMRGFTEETSPLELAALARKKKIPLLYDLGSGKIEDFGIEEFKTEPGVIPAVRSKADMVCFSGDKMLGGPQAGIIVGRARYITALRKHPLYRPLRPDKFCLSALEQTLLGYLVSPADVKLNGIFRQTIGTLTQRAEAICAALDSAWVKPSPLKATAGGGSTPEINYPSYGIAIENIPHGLEEKLRLYDPPIIVRTGRNKVSIDLGTVFPEQDQIIVKALKACLS